MSFSIGYLTIVGDLYVIMRALFVKTTRGSSSQHQTSLLADETSDITTSRYDSIEDQPDKRNFYRRAFGILKFLNLIPIVLGAAGGLLYVPGETNSNTGDIVQILRSVCLTSERQSY